MPSHDLKKINVYLVGDSTVAKKKSNVYPETGWGQPLAAYFDGSVIIDNRAADGRSTKSFMNENRWAAVVDVLKEGDYVFISFGHNDEKLNLPTIGVSLEDYKGYLVKYITDTRAKKSIPVLVTPIARRSFVNGKYVEKHGKYPEAMREVAKQYGVAIIELHDKSVNLVTQLGDEGSKSIYNWLAAGESPNYPNGNQDNTHTNEKGAGEMARLIVDGIMNSDLPLKLHVKIQ